jgi:prevent-host-death family protein
MAKIKEVSVVEAKKSLSELLGRVAYGHESITILKRGRPMARLVPVTSRPRPSLADVKGWLPDDDPFFAIMDEIVAERHARPARVLRRRRD